MAGEQLFPLRVKYPPEGLIRSLRPGHKAALQGALAEISLIFVAVAVQTLKVRINNARGDGVALAGLGVCSMQGRTRRTEKFLRLFHVWRSPQFTT